MLKIRLQRIGRKNDPSFRVILTDSRRGPKSGKYIEMLGSYDPRKDNVALKADRIKHWIQNGAQVSSTVHNILINENVIKGKKINVLPKKSPIIKKEKEQPKEEVKEEKEGSVESEETKTEEADEKKEDEKKPTAEDKPVEKEKKEDTVEVEEKTIEDKEEETKKEEIAKTE